MRILILFMLAAMLSMSPAAAETPVAVSQIANGVAATDWPEVAAISSLVGSCSATLVGCSTAITAAHCVCAPSGPGASCGNGESIIDPADFFVYVPQAGFFFVEEIAVSPTFDFGVAGDIAVLKLQFPIRGVRPRAVNTVGLPAIGTPATIVGFGNDREVSGGRGIKRLGAVITRECSFDIPNDTHVCWRFESPIGPAGTESNICGGDSGGPLLADLGAGTTVVGIHSGLFGEACDQSPSSAFDTDVFANRVWLAQTAGVNLSSANCGDGPQVGDAEVNTLGFDGFSTGQNFHSFTVTADTKLLRVGLNGEVGTAPNQIDLYLRFGSQPTTIVFDCSSAFGGSFEYCEIADPMPGTWFALVDRVAGDSDAYQLTVTQIPENPPVPPAQLGELLVSNFESFELTQVDPNDGRRAITSSSLRGFGADLLGPEGIAFESGNTLLVANAFARNLLRVDLTTGSRTVVSGCSDANCSSSVGGGPGFLTPRFVALEDDQHAVVTDRLTAPSGGFVSAVVRVDLATGERSVISGCSLFDGTSCTQLVGDGPAIDRIFGIAVDQDGNIIIADTLAILRIDPVSGDREILSGCNDAACTTMTASGPISGEPIDVLIDANGDLFVTYQREGFSFGAVRRVDPVTGQRTQMSGCIDTGCASQTGSGADFISPYGLAFDAQGDLLVADLDLDAVVHVDRETGDRTVVSGCEDASCSSAVGSGSFFARPIDVLVVPEPGGGPTHLLAFLVIVAGRARHVRRKRAAETSHFVLHRL